jgi:hypothetical protein
MNDVVAGECLCGEVRFRIERSQLSSTVIVCHCSLCRRWGTHSGAFTGSRRDALDVEGVDALSTYVDANGRERSFCSSCGSSLFWASHGEDEISISAGALDDVELTLLRHIHVASAAAWEEIPATLPRHPHGSSSRPE